MWKTFASTVAVLIATAGLCLALAGCGIKGPLSYPEPEDTTTDDQST